MYRRWRIGGKTWMQKVRLTVRDGYSILLYSGGRAWQIKFPSEIVNLLDGHVTCINYIICSPSRCTRNIIVPTVKYIMFICFLHAERQRIRRRARMQQNV